MKRLLALCAVACLLSSAALAAPVHTKQPEPLRVAFGETVNLADYLVPGKSVIFDFTSKYCGPCRAYDGPLHDLHAQRSDLVVVQVDINRPGIARIDWESPTTRQFELHSIPHFKVYGPDGRLVAEDKAVVGADGHIDRAASSNAGRRMVDRWINGSNE